MLSSQSQTQTPSQTNYRYYVTIDDAIERIGYGVFQYKLLVACGLCFMSDAIEVLLLSFLATCLQHEWNLTPWELQTLIAAVFGTLIIINNLFHRSKITSSCEEKYFDELCCPRLLLNTDCFIVSCLL